MIGAESLWKYGPAIVTLVGAIIAASGVFWSAYRQVETSRQLREKTQEIADLNQTLNIKSTETLNQLTGGDSFVYFEPLKRGGRLALFLRQAGNYPSFDVTLRLHESGNLLAPPILVGTVRRGSGFDWITFPPFLELPERPTAGDTHVRNYQIEVSARNGIFVPQHPRRAGEGRVAHRLDRPCKTRTGPDRSASRI